MGALLGVAICNLLAKPKYLKTMKPPTKKQMLEANKLTAQLNITNPSAFMPKKEVDGVRFPCCACQNLDRWSDEECRVNCLHYPQHNDWHVATPGKDAQN